MSNTTKKDYTEEELILMAINDRLRTIEDRLDYITFVVYVLWFIAIVVLILT